MTENLLRVRYDKGADVLYINVSREPAARGIEDRRGIVWRYGRDGNLIGVTIIDFAEIWGRKRAQLAGELSEQLHLSAHDVEHALPRA